MRFLHQIRSELAIQTEKPYLMRAQIRALAKQLPLLYLMLCTNSLALAYTHFGLAPDVLTLGVPGVLMPACLMRVVAWRRMRVDRLTDAQVAHHLRRTMVMVAVLGVGFTAWALSLYDYGGPYPRAHVAFFMSITVVGCIFCLVHLRPAALMLSGIVIVPFTLRFIATGEPVLTAIAVNLLLVSMVMVAMLLAYYEDFSNLVRSREHLKRLSESNRRAADLDILTGLGNRRYFFRELGQIIDVPTGVQFPFTLGLVDLDGFKPVNDLHGHAAGDRVLKEVSRRLGAIVGGIATVARLGGDEFGLILPGLVDHDAIAALGRRICEGVGQSITIGHGSVKVTASAGFATFPAMAHTQDQIVERADFALYHAKNRCRGTAVLFSGDHARQIRDRMLLEQELRGANLEAELWMAFQPMMRVADNHVTGFEALARWTSPVLGPVSPAAFIPAAERMGAIKDLTRILFARACQAALTWPPDTQLSFNLSADDLMDEDSADRLTAMVAGCGLPPRRIVFEITETAVMHDFEHALSTVRVLRELGCQIALDDFGTGYSSLSHVHRLPLDKLKIDQSFVRSLESDSTSRAIIESILDLAENLGIDCVVEGVETAQQIAILRAAGCRSMQGYVFGRPMAPVDVPAFLAATACQNGAADDAPPTADKRLAPLLARSA